jgi:hypothetical protein
MLEDDVELTASASEDEAVALSKLLNWFGFRDVRQYAVDVKDAGAVLKTCDTVRRRLAGDGTTRAPWVRGRRVDVPGKILREKKQPTDRNATAGCTD